MRRPLGEQGLIGCRAGSAGDDDDRGAIGGGEPWSHQPHGEEKGGNAE